MPLGDSITIGSNGGYRTLLWKKLVQQDGKKLDFVGSLTDGPADLGDKNHEGHGGWRIEQIRASIDNWSTTYKPELVLLHIGTNDMGQNFNVSTAPDRLKDLVNRICTNNPGVEVIVASIIPFSGLDSRINSYNATIPGIVSSVQGSGCKATFFNMNQKLTIADLGDGVHPTAAGYNKMAEAWYAPAAEAYNRLTAGQ
jgi:lysophospholipase L1-like esterase